VGVGVGEGENEGGGRGGGKEGGGPFSHLPLLALGGDEIEGLVDERVEVLDLPAVHGRGALRMEEEGDASERGE
jgi:hypothetical protein